MGEFETRLELHGFLMKLDILLDIGLFRHPQEVGTESMSRRALIVAWSMRQVSGASRCSLRLIFEVFY